MLRRRFGVRDLAIFGSYVRGEQKTGSDLDVLVEFDQVPSMFGYLELEKTLTEIAGVKVDLVMRRALKPRIGRRILAEAVAV
jgi:predicted nucleotidyltransferase